MRIWVAALIVAIAGMAALAQSRPQSAPASAPAAEHRPRYVDPLHGFSIEPPAAGERVREPSRSRLISWMRRDEKTGAVAMTLTVQQFVEAGEVADLGKYSKALADKLKSGGFKLDSSELTKVAGKDAIDVRGVTAPPVSLWQRQVWVLVEPGRFLVFVVAGPADAADSLSRTLQEALAGVQFTDPQAAREARKAALQRGREFLDSLTQQKFKSALRPDQRWFLLLSGGKEIGFVVRSEALAKQTGKDGVEVTVWTFLQQDKDRPRLAKQVLFTSFDAKFDRWKEQKQVGSGDKDTDGYAEDGAAIGSNIVCTIDHNGKLNTFKRGIPDVPYLPRAAGLMLPRLVDLTKPVAYAFGTYTTEANDFDMRTFTVVAPEKVTVDGRQLDAIRATDQPAADEEELNLWVDESGDLLRMELASWLTMERSTKEAVVAVFPQADAILKATEKWASQP